MCAEDKGMGRREGREEKIRKAKVKRKKNEEPEFYKSATNQPLLNYKVYRMKKKETLLWFAVAFAIGAAVAYLFYGGIGRDSYGQATMVTRISDTILTVSFGTLAGCLFIPIRRKQIIAKRTKQLRAQFIDMLDSLGASIAAGKNIPNAFMAARADLLIQYPEEAYIINELNQIIAGFENNIPIEEMLADFGRRSDIKDIENFGKVFEVSYRKGGNIKDVVRNTNEILNTKTVIELEIQTKVAASKREQNLMFVMPVLIVGMVKMGGGDFADNFVTPTGLISTTIAIGMFVVAYFVGRSVLKIEV